MHVGTNNTESHTCQGWTCIAEAKTTAIGRMVFGIYDWAAMFVDWFACTQQCIL